MKKVSILSFIVLVVAMVITSLTTGVFAQSDSRVKKAIEKNNSDFMIYFNKGDINSLVELYRDDACLVSRGCGKDYIRNYYQNESESFKFTALTITSVSVSDSIAVEKGKWSAVLNSGEKIGGEYLSEWKLTGNRWLIKNESSGLSEVGSKE
jgi:ketosteroid isomerase-like protein